MVVVEAYRFEEKGIYKQRPAGKCLMADMGKVEEQAEDRVTRDSQLVSERSVWAMAYDFTN
jgi:hypothetical protein